MKMEFFPNSAYCALAAGDGNTIFEADTARAEVQFNNAENKKINNVLLRLWEKPVTCFTRD